MVNRIDLPEYPNRIREWREERGLTQDQLAEKIGSHKTHISAWERGKSDLAMRWMHRIAAALNISVADVLSFRDNPSAIDQQVLSLVKHYRSATDESRFLILELAKNAASVAHATNTRSHCGD